MVVAWHRPTKAVIHKKAITENVANEVARLPQGKELFAVMELLKQLRQQLQVELRAFVFQI